MLLLAGLHTEALLKFMSKSDAKQITLYKSLRKLIVQHRSPFAPHQLWEGLYDMVSATFRPAAWSSKVHEFALAHVYRLTSVTGTDAHEQQ